MKVILRVVEYVVMCKNRILRSVVRWLLCRLFWINRKDVNGIKSEFLMFK